MGGHGWYSGSDSSIIWKSRRVDEMDLQLETDYNVRLLESGLIEKEGMELSYGLDHERVQLIIK
jgi:hypothetical protein